MPNQYGYFMPADDPQRPFPTSYQPARPVYVNQPAPQPQPQQPTYYSTPMYFVESIEEARSKEVRPGDIAIFFDTKQNKEYIKAVSQNGVPSPMKILTYEEEQEEMPASKSEIEELKKQLADMQTKLADLLK